MGVGVIVAPVTMCISREVAKFSKAPKNFILLARRTRAGGGERGAVKFKGE